MGRATHIIALVGTGDRGRALLEALLGVPGVEVRYYFDADPGAPGAALARERGIACRTDGRFDELETDADVDLIVETTGDTGTRAALEEGRHPHSRLLDPAGLHIVLGLLEARRAAALPDDERRAYERRLAELSAVVERTPAEMACYIRQASHQIKTPLSAVQSYVNVILGGYTGEIPERTREIVEKIHSRIEAALRCLGKCRVLADVRCSRGDDLAMGTVHLGELVGRAVELHAALAAGHGIRVEVLTHDGADLVRCDPQKTVTLLAELVENAVVYSRDGGLVQVSVEPAGDGRLAVVVRDRGIGIPERCLPRVFDEDYRADPAVTHHPDGAGVGLTIAREIARLQGFELGVESEEGKGSTFTLTVPTATAEHKPTAATLEQEPAG